MGWYVQYRAESYAHREAALRCEQFVLFDKIISIQGFPSLFVLSFHHHNLQKCLETTSFLSSWRCCWYIYKVDLEFKSFCQSKRCFDNTCILFILQHILKRYFWQTFLTVLQKLLLIKTFHFEKDKQSSVQLHHHLSGANVAFWIPQD